MVVTAAPRTDPPKLRQAMKQVLTKVADHKVTAGRLTALSGAQLGRSYVVQPALVIGRNSSQVRLDDDEVSRLHAQVWRDEDGTFHVEDLGSRNGTFLNGVQVTQAPLTFGDRVRVGTTTFVFARHDEESEVLFQRNRVDTVGHVTLGLVHDFNNALCVVKSMTALLRDEPSLSKSERDECLADMAAACERAEQLTKRMMGFARGHQSAAVLDLHDVVHESVRLVRRAIPENIELSVDVPPGLHVFGESTQLMQVILNLVINARDAIGANRSGHIEIRGAPSWDEIVLQIRDDGCGMGLEVRTRLFEPFFTTKGAKGNGIGLASVREIVHNHGGGVDVESTPGLGTIIAVRLPAEPEAPQSGRRDTPRRDAVPTARSSGESVLVLDPDPESRRAIAKLLTLAGYAVRTAGDLPKEDPGASPIELLVLDLDLDERDRVAPFILQQRDKTRHLAIVCLVSTPQESLLARARALGAHVVLPKPFNRTELLAAVQRALASVHADEMEETCQELPR